MSSILVHCEYCGGPCYKAPHQIRSNKHKIFFCCPDHYKLWLKKGHGWNKGKKIKFGHKKEGYHADGKNEKGE